jgi:hypothetical protein
LSGRTDKSGFNIRAKAKPCNVICAEDDGVIRLLPSLNPPGLAAGISSVAALPACPEGFIQATAVFSVKTATFFFESSLNFIEGWIVDCQQLIFLRIEELRRTTGPRAIEQYPGAP